MEYPKIGIMAPNFSLSNQHGENIELKSYRGKSNIVIYFYPKALTPGCTTQACAIRDSNDELSATNLVVFGVSPDAPAKLKKFDEKYNLGFPLLSDPNHEVADRYGVWGAKQFMGKKFDGIIRTSFFIDIEGKLAHIFEKVGTKNHHLSIISYMKDNG